MGGVFVRKYTVIRRKDNKKKNSYIKHIYFRLVDLSTDSTTTGRTN